jgi:CubicO group peptidase (beta-lactamase class C family)
LSQYSQLGAHRDWLHAITVHQLLTHTAGGWSNESNDPMFEMPGLNQEQLIAWTLKTHPLQNPPGVKYAYSNFGYCVLGRVIEHVGQQPYAQFVHQHVMNPAGIHDMRIATHKPAPNEVQYYGQGEDPYTLPITRMDSHGGWISSAADMAMFLAALFSPQDHEGASGIVSQASLQQMTQGTTANPGYACGLAVNTAGNAWHAGSLPGTMSLMVHTRTGISWAAALNTRSPKQDAATQLDNLLWQIARSVPGWRA